MYRLISSPPWRGWRKTGFFCGLDAVYTSVVVRWNRCSLNMVYCLSFNGYLHGVLTPGLSSRNQLGGSLSLKAFNNVVLSGDTSLE